MGKIVSVFGNEYDLQYDPREYYLFLRHLIGNSLYIYQYFDLYELGKDDKWLIEFRKNAERVHKEVDKFLKRILARMWKKNIRGEIYNLTVNLYNASKFNWNDIEKFKEFYNLCLITLEQLSKLYKPAKS